MTVYRIRTKEQDDGFWVATVDGIPEVTACGMTGWYARQRVAIVARRLLSERGMSAQEVAETKFWPKRYPECDCGAQTAYCDWTDREYCPRCDLWLTPVCRCDPAECFYVDRDRARPSDCAHCASVVDAQRARYESDPSYARPEWGMIWCETGDGATCCVVHREPAPEVDP